MKDKIVSDKYAVALLAAARKQNVIDLIASEILLLRAVFPDKCPLRRFLEGPQIPNDAKFALLQKSFENQINPLLYQFLVIVLRKHRMDHIAEIFGEYLRLVDVEHGIQEARVTTAVPLDTPTQSRLQAQLERLTQKKIRLHSRVDTRILGGVIVQIDNTLIDGSFRTQLIALREKLLNVKVN